jgi:Glyoxal oxidase N-terminus
MASPLQIAILAFAVLLLIAAPVAKGDFTFPFPWAYFNPTPGADFPDLPGYMPNPEKEPEYIFDPKQTEIQQRAAGNPLLLPVPERIQKVNWTSVVVAPNPADGFAGSWEIISNNTGVNCMHLAIAKHGKAIFIDTVQLGKSLLKLPKGNCRKTSDAKLDCFAHSAEFDYNTGKIRELKVVLLSLHFINFSLHACNYVHAWCFFPFYWQFKFQKWHVFICIWVCCRLKQILGARQVGLRQMVR